MNTSEALTLTTRDGCALQALRYPATGQVRGHLVVAGATGVPQLFYKNFALFAAQQGYNTLTVDYRGIGLSKPANLRGFQMDYLDWAFHDVAAAVDAMVQGVNAIVHFGGMSVEGPFEPILQANILGVYNLYEAARKHGVKRVVFASSNHVTGFYKQSETITLDHPAGREHHVSAIRLCQARTNHVCGTYACQETGEYQGVQGSASIQRKSDGQGEDRTHTD